MKVFVPYNQWNDIKENHKDLADMERVMLEKEDIIANIERGLEEVRLYKKGKLKTTSAKDSVF